MGSPRKAHLRRLHYQIVSQRSPVAMLDGRPYVNSLEYWKALSEASKPARYNGLVSWEERYAEGRGTPFCCAKQAGALLWPTRCGGNARQTEQRAGHEHGDAQVPGSVEAVRVECCRSWVVPNAIADAG